MIGLWVSSPQEKGKFENGCILEKWFSKLNVHLTPLSILLKGGF